jgi:hypothetical protein
MALPVVLADSGYQRTNEKLYWLKGTSFANFPNGAGYTPELVLAYATARLCTVEHIGVMSAIDAARLSESQVATDGTVSLSFPYPDSAKLFPFPSGVTVRPADTRFCRIILYPEFDVLFHNDFIIELYSKPGEECFEIYVDRDCTVDGTFTNTWGWGKDLIRFNQIKLSQGLNTVRLSVPKTGATTSTGAYVMEATLLKGVATELVWFPGK